MGMQRLFDHYTKNQFNPTAFAIESAEIYQQHKQKRMNLYVNKLRLPEMLWKGLDVLEVGCSSGENAVLLAERGACMSFVEPIDSSVNRLKGLFEAFGCLDSIGNVYVDFIENVQIECLYNVIIAEGFIHTLEKRRDVVRKLFARVSPGGFFITANPDPYGYFIEYFKTYIAHMYCRKRNIHTIADQVKAVEPFFLADFNRIAHSRPFSSWIKDSVFNPVVTPYDNFVYGFKEILNDLAVLHPVYYSSWPSYQSTNDLKWHKNVSTREEINNAALEAYDARIVSFVSGEIVKESDAIAGLFYDRSSANVGALILEVVRHMSQVLEGKADVASLSVFLGELICATTGTCKRIVEEMRDVIADISPEKYAQAQLLRSSWGVPFHYIVFRKDS